MNFLSHKVFLSFEIILVVIITNKKIKVHDVSGKKYFPETSWTFGVEWVSLMLILIHQIKVTETSDLLEIA